MNEFRKDILDTQNSLFGPFNDFKAGSDSAYYKIVPCSSSKPMWNQIKKDYTAKGSPKPTLPIQGILCSYLSLVYPTYPWTSHGLLHALPYLTKPEWNRTDTHIFQRMASTLECMWVSIHFHPGLSETGDPGSLIPKKPKLNSELKSNLKQMLIMLLKLLLKMVWKLMLVSW